MGKTANLTLLPRRRSVARVIFTVTSSKQEASRNQQERIKSLQPPPSLQSPSCTLFWLSLTGQAEPRPQHHQADHRRMGSKRRAEADTIPYLCLHSPLLSCFPQAQPYLVSGRESKPVDMPLRTFHSIILFNHILHLCSNSP